MIQVLTYSGTETNFKGKDVVLNKIHDAQSLDEFEINVIDLKDESMWKNTQDNHSTINTIDDFKSLATMIVGCKSSRVIILLPQNVKYYYYMWGREKAYHSSSELKDMISYFQDILGKLHRVLNSVPIIYENTNTRIGTNDITAAFHFNDKANNCLTRSNKSNKLTTIEKENVILSTLNINSYALLMDFLRHIHLIQDKEEVPEWVKDEKMFDDEAQLEIIEKNKEEIERLNKNIEDANEILLKNERYKSILYTNGDELVDVVFDILHEMLDWDLSEFVDVKNEDFNIKTADKMVIGEIKGVTSNVKGEHVSQLDTHVQTYLDEHPEDSDKIISLLIINHQRNKPLKERAEVHEHQIKLSKRNGSLIVETISLLKMFEKFLCKELTKTECIEILTHQTGLLTI